MSSTDKNPVFKAPRTLQEIQSEYQSTCLRAGDLQYRISVNSKDLELLNERLRELNFEAVAAQRATKEAEEKAKKESEEKKEEVKENA